MMIYDITHTRDDVPQPIMSSRVTFRQQSGQNATMDISWFHKDKKESHEDHFISLRLRFFASPAQSPTLREPHMCEPIHQRFSSFIATRPDFARTFLRHHHLTRAREKVNKVAHTVAASAFC
jgi:hypothetical protein